MHKKLVQFKNLVIANFFTYENVSNTSRNPVLRTELFIMHPDLNFTRPIFPNIPPPILSLFSSLHRPGSSFFLSPLAIHFSLFQTRPHFFKLYHTLPLSFSSVPPSAYSSPLFLTSTYSSSLLLYLPHSSKLFNPPPILASPIFPHAYL